MAENSADNKRIAINTIFLYIRMLFMMGISLYTSRVVLDVLGIDDYGIYNVVGGVVALFSFLSGTMSATTQRFLTFSLGAGDVSRTHKVFCTSLGLHIIISIIILILAETLGLWFVNSQLTIPEDRIVASNWVYQCSILATILLFISSPYKGAIIAHEKMSVFAYISIIEAVLRLALVFLLKVFTCDKLILYSVLILGVQLLIRIIYGWYCKRNFVECHYSALLFDKGIYKEMVGFTGWSLFGGVASLGQTQGLNILLNIFFTPAVNAARAISVQVQMAVHNFISNFQTALKPQITKSYATEDLIRMRNLINNCSKYSYFLSLLIVLPIFIEVDFILDLWLKEVPQYTDSFVRLMLCVSMIESVAQPIITAVNATGRIARYQATVCTLQILIIPVSYFALKVCDNPSVVFVFQLIFSIIAQMARILILQPLIHFSIAKYLRDVVVPIFLVTICSVIIPMISIYILPETRAYSVLICCISIISVVISVFLVGLKNTERKFIINKFLSFIKHYK